MRLCSIWQSRCNPSASASPEGNAVLEAIHPDLIGGVAAVLTTIAFIPQVIKSWQTRSTRDVSLGMFVIFGTFWLIVSLRIQQI